MQVWDGVAERFGVKLEVDYIDDGIVESQRKEEEEAFEKIKETMGIKELDFAYLPEEMKFQDSEIDKITNNTKIYYSYKDILFCMMICRSQNEKAEYNYLDGQYNFKENYKNDQNLTMEIWEIEQENNATVYAATIQHDSYSYICTGEIEYSEFIKILKFLVID